MNNLDLVLDPFLFFPKQGSSRRLTEQQKQQEEVMLLHNGELAFSTIFPGLLTVLVALVRGTLSFMESRC
jgi:hypothetical protein